MNLDAANLMFDDQLAPQLIGRRRIGKQDRDAFNDLKPATRLGRG
jgi:hypothetical protein